MSSFTYRDARRALVLTALAALGDEPHDLRAPLEAELAALEQDSWLVSDRIYAAAGADWLWETRLELKQAVEADPALLALGQAALLDDAQAAAIETLPHGPGGPPPDYLALVRQVVGDDDTIFMQLLHAGHSRWLAQADDVRAYPYDDVGVLLPVRLETLFDAPATPENPHPDRWQLLLRVVPDEASICRDNGHISHEERKAVTAFWQALQQPGAPTASWLDGDDAGVAWRQLCAQVTPPRAAWLVATLTAQLDVDGDLIVTPPADMPPAPQPNRVGGLPPELHVTVVTTVAVDDATEHIIGRLPQEPGRTIDAAALALALPQDFDTARNAWWNDWTAAKAVGLGGEFLLPAGVTPQNVDALYVVGLGDEAPASHFKAQIDAGELSLLPLGVPTNVVPTEGADPDVDVLAHDVETWRIVARRRLRQRLGAEQTVVAPSGRNVLRHLVGSEEESLPFFPGGDAPDDTHESRRMVQALWPVLWGHWMTDIWQLGEDAYRVGRWMLDNFCPEGPLMPLRIGDQPYGLLPVTLPARWQSGATFTPEASAQAVLEAQMAAALSELRATWNAGKERRTVVGKSTQEFMHLLGEDALSGRYVQRHFAPAWALLAPYVGAFGLDGEQQQSILDAALRAYEPAMAYLGSEPAERFLAVGDGWRLALPLVQPTAMTYRLGFHLERERVDLAEVLQRLLDGSALDLLFGEEARLRVLPDSLLIRLMVHAAQLVAPWRQQPQLSRAQRTVAEEQERALLDLAVELDQEAWRTVEIDEVSGDVRNFNIGIPAVRRTQLERALRATLDSAAHRLDPWVTGFAWQRLQQSAGPRGCHRLGVYGWVDGPFDGTPGPNAFGRLHTPSYNQTLTALILRDQFLSAERAGLHNDAGGNPWAMNISSQTARLAEEIAEEVRMGFHIYEVVGRHVENALGDQPGGHEIVKQLRSSQKYAMRPERCDIQEVCNGIAVLQGLRGPHEDFPPGEDADFPLDPAQQRTLQTLHAALDVYGDLLVADGVMQLISRQPERAGESMDAASGFARPPSFEFTRTPPSGYQLESLVLSALPYVAAGAGAAVDPVRLADPSVAAFVDTQLGDQWQWRAYAEDGETFLGAISLAELGFAPHEMLALGEDFLADWVKRRLGLDEAIVKPPREHALAQQLVAALGSRPAAGRDLGRDAAWQSSVDRQVYRELAGRYRRLHRACTSLILRLQAAHQNSQRASLLRRALIWGIAPVTAPADRATLFALLLGQPVPTDGTQPAVLAQSVAALLQQRLNLAPTPEELPAIAVMAEPLPQHEQSKQAGLPDGIPSLARAIANLAAPNSRLAILAVWPRARLLAASELAVDAADVALDETWLTVTAAVRADLARLEALQLELDAPLAAWSNSPGDPWQEALVAENRARRDTAHEKTPGEAPLGLRGRRFAAAYGSDAAWAGSRVAVGMIDAYSEAIPMPQRTSTAAFGFNAPAARAPQAILLAVPPGPRQRLDAALIQEIVAETRQLAHARTARLNDLGELQALTPTLWLQETGPERAYLEPYPLFE